MLSNSNNNEQLFINLATVTSRRISITAVCAKPYRWQPLNRRSITNMKSILFLVTTFFFLSSKIYGQDFNKTINKDSLLQTIVKDLPEYAKNEILKEYNEGDEKHKEAILILLNMPKSSKNEMIADIDSNFDNIKILKNEYSKLVPKNYIISIEFNAADKIAMTKESIDLKMEDTLNKQWNLEQEWNLEYSSKKIAHMLKRLNWTITTLEKIKKLLADAKCISIENGTITTIGFGRSGLGKYYFKLFESDLTNEQIEKYNDGCTYIFYKKNIVLEYGGGAAGSQCFPD